MHRFIRIVLIFLGGLLTLAAVLLLGMNLYVQSQGTQARIRQELSRRLRTTLQIQRTSVTPWGGLKLSGITIPQAPGSPAGAPNFLEARSFGLQVGFLSLFSGRLVVTNVSLIDPKVVWSQNENGKWSLPGAEEKSQVPVIAPPASTESTEQLPVPSSAPEEVAAAPRSAASPPVATPQKSAAKLAFVPDVRRLKLADGDFRFLDRSGNLVAEFERVDFRSAVRNAVDLDGRVRIGRISLRNRFFLDDLKSPLHYEPGRLEFSKISARASDGEVIGKFSMQPQSQDSPFTVETKFRNIPIDRVIMEAGGPRDIVRGQIEGNLQATGQAADPNALTGSGEILLRDGEVRQYSLLVALGDILQIEELKELHLEQADAKYHLTPGLVTVDELVLRSKNIRLSATGTVSFSGKLHLDSQLAIDEKIRDQLFKPIRVNFQPANEPGYFALDFQVRGTVERPKTNLLKKVVGHDLQDFFGRLLGDKNERPKKEKSNIEPPADVAPVSPTPGSAENEPAVAVTPSPSP